MGFAKVRAWCKGYVLKVRIILTFGTWDTVNFCRKQHIVKNFKKNIINLFGERGKQWLNQLPKIIAILAQKWQLTDIAPVDNMSWNYVAKASSKSHMSVCIKISMDETLIADEIKALSYFNGHGMVKLIEHDPQYHALLLHQAIPGTSLNTLYLSDKNETIAIYSEVACKLLSAHNGASIHFKHVKDWLNAFNRLPENKLPDGLIRNAKFLSQKMLEQENNEFILHGDLHMDNIISDSGNWIAIDPKGIVGPKEFEIACFDFITKDELLSYNNIPELFNTRTFKLSQLLKIEQVILANWVFIRLVLGACWMIEDNGNPDIFLNQIKAIFPESPN